MVNIHLFDGFVSESFKHFFRKKQEIKNIFTWYILATYLDLWKLPNFKLVLFKTSKITMHTQ